MRILSLKFQKKSPPITEIYTELFGWDRYDHIIEMG